MKSPIPFVANGKLHAPGGAVILPLPGPAERTGWQDWLENPAHTSFRYESATGAEMTVIKEPRKTAKGETIRKYWRGHCHVLGKLRRKYLGVPENLTIQALEAAVVELAQVRIGERDKRKKGALLGDS